MRKITLGTVYLTQKTKEYVDEILASGRLTYGKFTSRLEREFAQAHNRKIAIFTNSGTSALQVAIHTLKEIHGWQNGDEVLIPATTFIADVNTVTQNQLVPVFVDVDPTTYNIDPAKIEEKITPKTRAIMPVHLMGLAADMDPILEIARRHNLKVIEDSCETMFVNYKGRPVGSFGDIACFSTYAAHLLVTGVGGFALTDNEEYALMMKSLMNHGRDAIYLHIDDDDDTSNSDHFFQIVERRFSFLYPGYSYRLTEFEAAVGLAMMEDRDKIFARRRENAMLLLEILKKFREKLQLPVLPPDNEHAFMMFPIVAKDGVDREELLKFLELRGIETRHLMPLLTQPVVKKQFGDIEGQYPVAKRLNKDGFYIGCHQDLSKEDIEYVGTVFGEYFANENSARHV